MLRWRRYDDPDDDPGLGSGGPGDGGAVQERFVRVVGLAGPAPGPRLDGPTGAEAPGRPTAAEALGGPTAGEAARPGAAVLAAFDPGRRGVRALTAAAVAVALVAAGLAWWGRPRVERVQTATAVQTGAAAPAGGASPVPGGAGPAGSPGASPAVVVVSVAGRVARPGLVRLPAGARVADALDAAGGALPGTDLSYLNLARRLADGELVLVGLTPPAAAPAAGPGAGGPAGGEPPAGPVNLNTASLAQLDALPGVGPVLAQRIIDHRSRRGGFRSVAELRQVDGVGDARYEQLKDLVTV